MSESLLVYPCILIALLFTGGRTRACLPKDVKTTDVVSTRLVRARDGSKEIQKVMVDETLKKLKAKCKKGKLVDASGKEIYFYRLRGCWGNPPADYQDILSQQQRELEDLRKRYRVIEMTCNASGGQIL